MRQKIEAFFKDQEETPLFYIESGSRLWGIASPDSDYDVRGFHIQSKQQYYDYRKHRDMIETIDGDFDFVSYDLDKMFGLLARSNPTVLEWIRAHIVYYNELPDWKHFQADVIANYDYRALFRHYLSMGKGTLKIMESEKRFTYKTTFYCIRGLLSADVSSRRVMPALLIDDLFRQFDQENEVLAIARESLEKKKQRLEREEVAEGEKGAILSAVYRYLAELEGRAPEEGNDRERLGELLRRYCIRLKEQYYASA